MVSPSLCGGFLTDKRSTVAFTWTITTMLTILAFLVAIVLTIQIHTHYYRMERYYQTDEWYQTYYKSHKNANDDGNQNGENQGGGGASQDEIYDAAEQISESYQLLSNLSARSITFVAFYTVTLALALSLYGSTAIVGFTSLRGDYITPCFSSGHNRQMRVGVFGGAVVIFANLLLVCAVVLGEVRVEDFRDYDQAEQNQDEMEPYQVERIAAVLAVTCMFLSALYTIFAVLLFLYFNSEEIHYIDEHDRNGVNHAMSHTKPLVTVTTADQRTHIDNPGFITMEDSS